MDNRFSGLLHFPKEDAYAIYPFNLHCHTMTVLSINGEDDISCVEPGTWIFGLDENNYDVAFLCNNNVAHRNIKERIYKYSLSVPVVIKSNKNMTSTDLGNFDGLCFSGGVINHLYPFSKALSYKSDSIVFEDPNKYTITFNANLDSQKVKVTLSIDTSTAKSISLITNTLGSVNSYIRLEFNESQSIEKLTYYEDVVQRFLSFCVGMKNTGVETKLLQKNIQKTIQKTTCSTLESVGSCLFNYNYSDVASKDLMSVLRLDILGDYIAPLLEMFDNKKKQPYLEFLPSSNQEASFIHFTQICMLYTALEREYGKHNFTIDEDKALTEYQLKLNEFVSKTSVDNLDNKYIDSIKKAINGLSVPAGNARLIIFYNRYREYMSLICERYIDLPYGKFEREAISKIFSEEDFEAEIKKFVKLRNDITHQGVFEWKERADIYAHLYLIFCFSVLERAGMEPTKASSILSWLFSKNFYK